MRKQLVISVSILILISMALSACSAAIPQTIQSLVAAPETMTDGVNKSSDTSVAEIPSSESQQTSFAQAGDGQNILAAYQETLKEIYTQVNPSVVTIQVRVPVSAANFNFGGSEMPFSLPGLPGSNDENSPQIPQYQDGLGSGFIWDREGHIVTNNHVVEGASEIEVTFSDGSTYEAELVGADSQSDLAVLSVNADENLLIPVQMADSTQVQVGQLAIAIGNPFGLENTMTVGIVSALGRTLPASTSTTNGAVYSIPDIIQTDAPINPGNSGGVLVDDQGAVIGVTAAIESPVGTNAGIGFVIPSALVDRVVPELIANGSYQHSYLGISGTTLTRDLATAMGLDESQRGILVYEVANGGPADQSGLVGSTQDVTIDGEQIRVGGDIITAIDGTEITKMEDLIAYLASHTEVGQKVVLTIIRDGSEKQIDVELGARPGTQASQEESRQAAPQKTGAWLGILGGNLTSEISESMDLASDQEGVLVQRVEDNSPASRAGLLGSSKAVDINGQQVLVGGDVIIALNGKTITSIEELRASLGSLEPGTKVVLTVLRNGDSVDLPVTLGEPPQS